MLMPSEHNAIDALRRRVQRLMSFFEDTSLPLTDNPADWYAYLAQFKDELGNIHNAIGLIATLLAKEYLTSHFDIRLFDAAEKAQGAPGFDIDVRTSQGQRIVGEIKATHPYKADDLGAAQASSFSKDAGKLLRTEADFKFFFLTDRETFDVMGRPKYRRMFSGAKVVHLPSGDEIAA